MEFRKAKKENLEQVYELVQETIREVYPKYYLKEIVDMFREFHNMERIAQDVEAGNVYILFDEGNLIGTGTINANHITRVYVWPRFQGRGYGTFIMNCLEELIRENYDFADIDASLPACRLYAHLGYETIDHGMWECANGVIQVYEIMKKQLKKHPADSLKFRPYKPSDAEAIVSWIKDETVLRKWSSDRFGDYPIKPEDINHKYLECNGDCEEADNFYPMTAADENGPVGHLILRYTNPEKTTIRLGFIIVDESKRGKGYGKRMVQMATKYAFEMLKAEKVTLGVFDNNPAAYHCYKAAGFEEIKSEKEIVLEILGEQWKIIELERKRE